MLNRAVVTGVGVLAANGIGKDAFWRNTLAGKSGIGPITLFDASDLPCRIAGEVKGFDPEQFIDPSLKPAKRMARFTQLGLAAARMAIEDAGLDKKRLCSVPDLPVVLGVSTSALDLRARKPGIFTAVEGVPHACASAIGYMYNRSPRLLTVSDGCASSLDAVAKAVELIRTNQADLVIAGGAEGAIERYVVEIMLKCRRCSVQNDNPGKASRPFDKHRDYGVMAEGAGILVLENMQHAMARGVRMYGEVTGYGTCADHASAPEGSGLARSMVLAMDNAGLRRDEIDHVSAHGPSDIDMDRT
jgi:3-oxoacyl-[acyl-carrier-protein] synthase II